jgi:hypothetical protein
MRTVDTFITPPDQEVVGLLPAALASVPFGNVLARVRVQVVGQYAEACSGLRGEKG